jgi:hypothetical protein
MVGKLEIDLVVTGENGKKLAIECDGEKFHPPEKLSEDLARERILRNWGWIFERIRGSAFYRDEEIAMTPVFSRLDNLGIYPRTADNIDPSHQEGKHQELRQRIEACARDLRGKWETDGDITAKQYQQDETWTQSIEPVQKESQDRLIPEVPSVNPTVRPVETFLEDYSIADLSRLLEGSLNLQTAKTADLLRMIVEVAKQEGPVHQETLLKRIRGIYGIGRLKGSTKESVLAAVNGTVRALAIDRSGDFFYIDGDQFSNTPRKAGDRTITEIHSDELRAAINTVKAGLPTLSKDALIKEVARQLGYLRVGPTIRSTLGELVQ